MCRVGSHTLLSTTVAAGPGVGVALVRDLAQVVIGEADGGCGGHAVAQVHGLAGGGRVYISGGRTIAGGKIKNKLYLTDANKPYIQLIFFYSSLLMSEISKFIYCAFFVI